MRTIKVTLLSVLIGSSVMMTILCAGQHSPLSSPKGGRWVFGAAIALAVYGFAGCFVVRSAKTSQFADKILWGGIVGAIIQMIHMSLEAFGSHVGDRPGITVIFMSATFAVWFAIGIWSSVTNLSVRYAPIAGALSAMLTMSIAVAFGLLLTLLGFPDDAYVRGWPEFIQSGWKDPRAFTIANSFDAIVSHFLIGPVMGALLGGLGGGFIILFRWMQPRDTR